MAGVNSKRKGKVGELEWVGFLREHGVNARRGQQYKGGGGSPDVVSELPVHWEVKRTEKLQLYKAMEQAISEAAPGKVPVVAHRRNRGEWMVILRAEDFLKLWTS